MPNSSFVRWAGIALVAGGLLTILINAVLTPMLPKHVSFDQTASSAVFLWRQSSSALAVGLILLGSVGLYLRQSEKAGLFGAIAFLAAFLGGALILATEWSEIFLVRDLAFRFPATLKALDTGSHPNRYDLGAMMPIGLFTLGWIALAASTFRTAAASRRGAILVIAGFFAIPMLMAALGIPGAVLGNLILGSGWMLLGNDVRQHPAALPDGIVTITTS